GRNTSRGKLAGSVALLPLLIVIASSPLPSTTRSPDFSTDTSVPAAALATALAMRSSGDLPQAASPATRRTITTYGTVRILRFSKPSGDGGGIRSVGALQATRSAEQGAQARLHPATVFMEPVALGFPAGKACRGLAPLRRRMVGAQQVAQLVHQHVLEGRGPRQHQRQVEGDAAVGGQRSPLRGHHLEAHLPRRARQRRQVARQPAPDVGARLAFVEILQRAPQ